MIYKSLLLCIIILVILFTIISCNNNSKLSNNSAIEISLNDGSRLYLSVPAIKDHEFYTTSHPFNYIDQLNYLNNYTLMNLTDEINISVSTYSTGFDFALNQELTDSMRVEIYTEKILQNYNSGLDLVVDSFSIDTLKVVTLFHNFGSLTYLRGEKNLKCIIEINSSKNGLQTSKSIIRTIKVKY